MVSLGVSESHRSFLGRWGARRATDTYVRTAVRVVENLQVLAGRHARAAFQGGPDYSGEEHILEQLRDHLLAKGVPDCVAEDQLARLRVADQGLDPTPFGRISEGGALDFDQEPSSGDGALVPLEVPPAEATAALEDDADEQEGDGPNEDDFRQALLELEDGEVDDATVPTEGFIVAITQRGLFRRLHRVGGCKRVPGEHFLNWEEHDSMPEPHPYNAACLHCFPVTDEAPDESSVGSESSSEIAEPEEGGGSD